MENQNSDEIQIDIFRAIKAVLRKSPLIIVATILVAVVTYPYFDNNIYPKYSTSGKIYVIDKEGTEINLSIEDLDIGSRLVEDYMQLITSRIVLEKVIKDLALDITFWELKNSITVVNPQDSRIIEISLRFDDSTQIMKILNRVEDVTCDYLSERLGTEHPMVLERASEPVEYYESSAVKNTILCMGVVAFGLVALFAGLDILNMNIRYQEEIGRCLQLNVIGNVPYVSKLKMRRKNKN